MALIYYCTFETRPPHLGATVSLERIGCQISASAIEGSLSNLRSESQADILTQGYASVFRENETSETIVEAMFCYSRRSE